MYDPVLRWKKSPSGDVSEYIVTWSVNGNVAGSVTYMPSSSGNIGGYSSKFSQTNSGITLIDGDVLDTNIIAKDVIGLDSTPINSTITIPSEPPEAPVDVVLSLS